MSWILIAAVLLVALLIFIGNKMTVPPPSSASEDVGSAGRITFPYQPAKPLFSAAESSFLSVLDQVVGPEFRVFGKVRVADVAAVRSGLSNSARQGALNRIAAKHFDFVVCRRSDLVVVCAYELNDRSHSSQRAQARDDLLANVCSVIRLPLLTVPAKATYSVQDLRSQFSETVEPSAGAIQVGT